MKKSVSERLIEFADYHVNGDGECNGIVLKTWADKNGLDLEERWELAYMYAVTYCTLSAIVLYEDWQKTHDATEIAARRKNEIIFQSDRKYAKMRDCFRKLLEALNGMSAEWFLRNVGGGVIDTAKAVEFVEGWYMFGRFSAFLLIETFSMLTGIETTDATIEWKKGNTATSGLMNVFCLDEFAEAFDKKGELLVDEETLDGLLERVKTAVKSLGGSTDVTEIETSLCAYRKFYKGSRYNGYYLDRMLGEITDLRGKFPKQAEELTEIRKKKFKKQYLGEYGGWSGIRKELKTAYRNFGLIT